MTAPRRPAFASQDWMLEQQLRAEMEAEAWRRLRELSAGGAIPPDAIMTATHDPRHDAGHDYHNTGSILLKAVVRFALASLAAYVGWIAAVDAQLAAFDVWLSVFGVFVAALAVTLVGPARGLVHMLAETIRWVLIIAAALGGLWLLVQGLG